jgi:histidine triad (HIT) family protein
VFVSFHVVILDTGHFNATRFLRIYRILSHTDDVTLKESSMADDLFLKIINREIPADIVYETDEILAFRDISPKAPVHILIIPKEHIETINDLETGHAEIIGNLFLVAAEIAAKEGIADDGYRVVMNCNQSGGQAVYHIHLHLLGGRQMGWPPG